MIQKLLTRSKQGQQPTALAIALDNDWVYFDLSKEGSRRREYEDLQEGVMLRASPQDVVIAPGSARGSRLRNLIINDVRSEFAYFRKSSLVYATSLGMVYQGGFRVSPVTVVLDTVRRERTESLPCVVGLLLGEGNDALALAWVIRSNGAFTAPVVVAGHDELDQSQAVDTALNDAGLAEAVQPPIWLSSQELYEYASAVRAQPYPLPDELFGVPRVRWAQASIGVAAIFALYGGALAWEAHSTGAQLQAEQQRVERAPSYQPKIRTLTQSHVTNIARLSSLDFEDSLKAVLALQQPYTKATLELHRKGVTVRNLAGISDGQIVVRVDSAAFPDVGGKGVGITGKWLNQKGLNHALTTAPAAGWSVGSVASNSEGTVVQVVYDKESQ